MANRQVNTCPHCGGKVVRYPHTLTPLLMRGLYKAARAADRDGKYEIGAVPLSYSQRQNLQKAQYWGLIEKYDPARPRGGWWVVTPLGYRFLRNECALQRVVWTFRGKPVEFEGPHVTITSITGGWWWRDEYAQAARPEPDPQWVLDLDGGADD